MATSKRNTGIVKLCRQRPPFLDDQGRWWHWEIRTEAGTEASGWTRGDRKRAEASARQGLERLHEIEQCTPQQFVINAETHQSEAEVLL